MTASERVMLKQLLRLLESAHKIANDIHDNYESDLSDTVNNLDSSITEVEDAINTDDA